jgi:hypothetical protein
MLSEEKDWAEEGFSKSRTVRVLGISFLLVGAVFIVLGCVLDYAHGYASHIVELALARYSNFTGQIALSSFSEDQQLMAVVQSVKTDFLPLMASVKPFVFVLGILMAVLGVACEVLPKPVGKGLLKLHILKPASGDSKELPEEFRKRLRLIAIVAGAVIFVVVGIGIILHFTDPNRETPAKVTELEQEASRFYALQKAYFKKNNAIGTWEQIGYQAPTSEYFVYEKKGKYSWRAKNIQAWEKCPEASVWRVSFEVTGFFTKELKMYAARPDNKACEALTPEFRKNVLR